MTGLLVFMLAPLARPASAAAGQPTLQDISKSFENRLNQKPDSGNYTAILLGAAAVAGLLILASQWGRQREKPRVSNRPGRLLREIRPKVHLTRTQLKRLKLIAERRQCNSPLTVILCPSLLERRPAAAKPSPDAPSTGD